MDQKIKSLIIFLVLLTISIPLIVAVHELGHVIACEFYGFSSNVEYIFGGNHTFSGITNHQTVSNETVSTIISFAGGYFTAFIFAILYICVRPSTISAQIIMPFIVFQQLVYGTFEGLLGWPEVESQWILLNILYGILLLIIIKRKTDVIERIWRYINEQIKKAKEKMGRL